VYENVIIQTVGNPRRREVNGYFFTSGHDPLGETHDVHAS
jgi:hypothetical protein